MQNKELWEKMSQAWWDKVDRNSGKAPPESDQWADVISVLKNALLEEHLLVPSVAEISPMSEDALILRYLEVAETKARFADT